MTNNSKHTRFGLSVATIGVAIILVTGLAIPSINQAYAATTVGGEAKAVSISSPTGSLVFMDTGPLVSTGEADAKPVSIKTPLVSADGLLAFTLGSTQSESQSAIGNLVLLPGNPNQITAYFTMAKASATCSGVLGSSDITSLTMGGQTIQVTGQPNQVVGVPGVLTLTINEQIVKGNSITVNALHLHTALGTDVIISSATSSASCSTALSTVGALLNLGLFQSAYGFGVSSTPGCNDFATSGGWVEPPPNKGTFGFVAGYKDGGTNPSGSFDYQDHTSNINVNSTDVSYYNCGPYNNSRVFGGDAEVNNSTGYCYQVYAQDNNEPGKGADYFAMWVWLAPSTGCSSDGSAPTGTLYYATGNYLGGGNIQLHTT